MGLELNEKEIFRKIDDLIENAKKYAILTKLNVEIESRKNRHLKKLGNRDFFLAEFAGKIAYSQQARSDKVTDMLETGIFREIFADFNVDKVAKMDSNEITDKY